MGKTIDVHVEIDLKAFLEHLRKERLLVGSDKPSKANAKRSRPTSATGQEPLEPRK